MKKKMLKITQNNEILHVGEDNADLLGVMHRLTSSSSYHAMKYEGYKVEEATEEDIKQRISDIKESLSNKTLTIFKIMLERELRALEEYIEGTQ